jgi:putative tricarboxylic transport membrane protein
MIAFMDFLTVFTQPELLVLVGLGTFAGVYVGAIPGLSVTMAVSILISFTFSWDVYPAISLMIGIYTGGVYGGSRTAILLNIPGARSAIATALDGYPMAKRGEAGTAIGVTTVMSFIGGLVGIAIGAVGRDPLTFAERFTFDFQRLEGGISFVAVMIGMFGVSEALLQLHHVDKEAVRQKISRIVPSLATVKKHLPLSLQTSTIGVTIGGLPGTGGDIAALMAYHYAKRVTKSPERPFGDGAMEGLVAPETANNAAVGGAFIPMMTLGIPGDAVTAIMIGALFIHGLNPGPMLMIDKPDMFWFIVGCLIVANFFMLFFGLTGIKLFTKIVEMPRSVLIPLILLLSIIGAYAVNNSITDVYWMLGFGIFGYVMRHCGYPLGPVILGVILSRLLDENWRRAIISEREDLGRFFDGIVTSPLSLMLFVSVIVIFVSQTSLWSRGKAIIPRTRKVRS